MDKYASYCTQHNAQQTGAIRVYVGECLLYWELQADTPDQLHSHTSVLCRKVAVVLWAHVRWTEMQWKRVLCSDESKFRLFWGKKQLWLLPVKGVKASSLYGWLAFVWRGVCWQCRFPRSQHIFQQGLILHVLLVISLLIFITVSY